MFVSSKTILRLLDLCMILYLAINSIKLLNFSIVKVLPDYLLSSGNLHGINKLVGVHVGCKDILKQFFKAGVTPDFIDDSEVATLLKGNSLLVNVT